MSPLLQWRLLILAVALVIGLLIAIGETGQWDLILRFIYQVPYGQNDPLFDKDIGFYLFSLPVYVALKNWMLLILLLSALMAGAVYFVHGEINLDRRSWRISPAAIAHGSALLGLYFAVKAWSYALDRFLLLYNDNGVVVGAGYTDVHVELPVLWLLVGLAAAAAVVAWANVRLRTYRLAIVAATLVFGSSFVFAELLPALFQRFFVKPSELQLETPYIQRNIALTREAYNLRQITVKPFPAEQGLTFQSLQDNRGTIDNIRLWDWQPLMDTYAQLQEIRTYYKFLDVDIDRYQIDGSYQQVTLAARELAPSLLSANAQTWVNLHLLFTHGNGVVMSPVTQKSAEGLPIFYLKDIPPVATGGLGITEPRIYFGQGASALRDRQRQHAGVRLSEGKGQRLRDLRRRGRHPDRWDRLEDAVRLVFRRRQHPAQQLHHQREQDPAPSQHPGSRAHDRAVPATGSRSLCGDQRRAALLDAGRLHHERLVPLRPAAARRRHQLHPQFGQGGHRRLQRDGRVLCSDAADPIIATYRRIFPALFKPFDAMPPDLQQHIRYPEDLFRIQAQHYRAYHMDAPEVFYNREDLWQFPREPTGPDGINNPNGARMAPYYIMMRLPGEPRAEFFLMLPMVPSQRENMIAWLAARCDPPDYGKLIVYEFPKDKLVYGPFQIEARINQNTEISQQISLWNQMGSRVIRGNLLVVPIENSILYVSPLYLRAESGQLPELKRVIAAYGDRVVMEETLPAALAALFKESVPAAPLPARAGASSSGPTDERAREALGHYDRAIERLKVGDWSGFGTELDALRPLLEELSRQPAAR